MSLALFNRHASLTRNQDINQDIGYVPNRYFNQMYPHQTDLYSVSMIIRRIIM